VPPPAGASKPAQREFEGFDQVFDYLNPAGDQPLFYIRRREARNGEGKQFIPLTYGELNGQIGWHAKAPGAPRPLYGLDRLAATTHATVIICEGEKAAIAAQHMFPDHACVTWPGGAKAVEYADLKPLRGRKVIVWPDNDQDGHRAASALRDALPQARILQVTDLPEGDDAADVSPQDPEAWLADRLVEAVTHDEQSTNDAKDAPPPGTNGHAGGHHSTDDGTDTVKCDRITHTGATKIPPRPWAYGTFLLFGSAAVLGAVDGAGKGAIAVVMALAMITGKPLLGERVWRKGPVVVVTYEDDVDEWHRRIAAACLHYELDCETVLKDIHFLHKPGGRVSFASIEDGTVTFPDSAQIIHHLKTIGAVLLIIDPFNHAHELDDGNNNVMIAKVAGEVSRIVHEAYAAGLAIHHLRKGSSGQVDDLMGATSLRATFRSTRILQRMTPDVAGQMKITDAWRYIRIAGSKENYAPPPEKATWFKLVSVPLGNCEVDPVYPDGDDIGVATTWQPRPMFDGMDTATLRAVFQELRQTVHGPARQAKNTPWAGKALIDIGKRSDREATTIVAAWLESGVLIKGEYRHAKSRHTVQRVTLDDAKAASILAELETVGKPAGTE
jgi:hypothetical protein